MTEASGKKSLPNSLRPAAYQLIPLAKLIANCLGGILIADGVGVGKTISAGYVLTYAAARFRKPGFVVCTPTMIPKWLYELKSKFGATTIPIRSMEDLETSRDESIHRRQKTNQPVYVMSNSLLSKATAVHYPHASAAVLDEIHTYRNAHTRWFKGCLELSRAADLRLGLTATPINNTLDDLVSELSILLPEYPLEVVSAAVNDLWHAKRETLTNALITRFLKDKLRIHFVKRVVESVKIQYPESYVRQVATAIGNRTERGSLLEQITYYRLAASSPRAFWVSIGVKSYDDFPDPKLEALARLLQDQSVSHWLVFCEFTETVEFLAKKLVDPIIYTMTGDTPIFERQPLVESFRKTPRGALLLTSVGSEGLDLQFCGGLVNYDLHWNPMKLEQRAGRIDRLGQEKDKVRIVNIRVLNSIDDRVLSVMKRKLDIISNSVFSPGPILATEGRHPKGPRMYDDDSVVHELDAGSRLVDAFRLNETLESRDYDALEFVDKRLCDPLRLAKTAGSIRPETLVQQSQWITGVTRRSKAIAELLRYYS